MEPTERPALWDLVARVHDFYGKEVSQFTLDVWWESMRGYDLAAVKDALNRHAVDPDVGQFAPKPADVVKLISGRSADAALVAWAKVDRAVRCVGAYQSVVFDDPIIHAAISDMGGWTHLCSHAEDEWPFRAREFENRYRGFKLRGKIDAYPAVLVGIAEAQNGRMGYRSDPPVMIGDEAKCRSVFASGAERPSLVLTPMSALLPAA